MEDEIKKSLLEGEEEQENPMADGSPAPVVDNPAEDANEDLNPASDGTSPSNPENPESQEPVLNDTALEDGASREPVIKESESAQPDLIEENGAVDTSIKTFTQEDVDKLVGDTRVKTREKTFRYIYDRYGVKNEEELDGLIANAQRYDTQKEMYENDKSAWESERDENSKRLNDMSEQIALMQSEIDPARYEDAKLIIKGKGMEVNLENIEAELATHPEWKKEEVKAPVEMPAQNPEPVKPTMRIKALGNEQKPAPEMSEEEEAQKLFKMKW